MKVKLLKANFYEIEINKTTFYISYNTPIAVRHNGKFWVSENEFSRTTGKHLNMISDNKSKRIPHAMLMEKINDIERSGL
jgi:hypothetical protein